MADKIAEPSAVVDADFGINALLVNLDESRASRTLALINSFRDASSESEL